MYLRTMGAALCGAALGLAALTANAGDMSLNHFQSDVLPVLIKVDSNGDITHMLPATELHGKTRRRVRAALGEMITGPAMDDGEAIASQLVVKLGVDANERDDGNYDVHFTYADAQPVPSGSWHWNEIDGHRLALTADDPLVPSRRGPTPYAVSRRHMQRVIHSRNRAHDARRAEHRAHATGRSHAPRRTSHGKRAGHRRR